MQANKEGTFASLLFTPKTSDGQKSVPDYMSPKPSRSPSTGYSRGQRENTPGSMRRRSLTPTGSFRETPPPPPSDSLLADSPAGGASLAQWLPADVTTPQRSSDAAGPSTSTAAPSGIGALSQLSLDDSAEQWVTVFGFSPSQLELVLQEFHKCGDIVQFGSFGQGPNVNWVHIQYQNKYCAQRAFQRNGILLTPSLMVGVKKLDQRSMSVIQKYQEGHDTPVVNRPQVANVRPYTVQRKAAVVAQPETSTWSKINEFVFGL